MITISKEEIINLLELVSPTRLTVKQIVEKTSVNKQTVSRCLKKIGPKEREMYNLHSAKFKTNLIKGGKVWVHYEKQYWCDSKLESE